jgi:hypothetical protein
MLVDDIAERFIAEEPPEVVEEDLEPARRDAGRIGRHVGG